MMAAGVARRYGGCKPLAPVGLHGEAVIDLNAGDAARAGFGQIVLILGPATGPAINYHVRRTWPVLDRRRDGPPGRPPRHRPRRPGRPAPWWATGPSP